MILVWLVLFALYELLKWNIIDACKLPLHLRSAILTSHYFGGPLYVKVVVYQTVAGIVKEVW